MSRASIGILWALAFVILESIQFVYFGGLFQRVNSYLFGFCVFTLTTLAFVGVAAVRTPGELRIAFANPGLLLKINLTATLAWIAFLGSVQLIEPAIAYTVGSGVMPLTAYLFYRLNWPEGEPMRNRREAIGNLIIGGAILFLCLVTVFGYSGFVRGGALGAVMGIGFAIADGFFFTLLLIYCQRLDRSGAGPSTVFGLRFPLYAITAGMLASATMTQADTPTLPDLALITALGLLLIIPPLYALQRAVALISTLTLSALTATGPLVIFLLQIIEGRVLQSGLTLLGLAIYFGGALLAAQGAVSATRKIEP